MAVFVGVSRSFDLEMFDNVAFGIVSILHWWLVIINHLICGGLTHIAAFTLTSLYLNCTGLQLYNGGINFVCFRHCFLIARLCIVVFVIDCLESSQPTNPLQNEHLQSLRDAKITLFL